jgi:hypothetical protein
VVLVCLPLVASLGCDSGSSSPVNPDDPIILSGTVETGGRSEHEITMPADGLLRLTLADVRAILIDITQFPPDSVNVGLGLGGRNELGACILTTNFVINEGDQNVYRLSADDYCIAVFDPGFLPEDAVMGYTLELEIAL